MFRSGAPGETKTGGVEIIFTNVRNHTEKVRS
jgi:hypothetical protein